MLIFRRGSRWPAPASGPAFGWPPSGLGRRVLAVNRPAGYLTRGFDARPGFGTMATSHHVVGDVRRAWCEGGRTLCRADLPGTPIPGLIELGVETRSEEPGAAGRHVTRSSGIVRPARTSTQTIVPSRIGPISTTITSPGPSGVAVGVGLRPLAPRRPRTGPAAPGGTGGGPDARAADSPPKQRPGAPVGEAHQDRVERPGLQADLRLQSRSHSARRWAARPRPGSTRRSAARAGVDGILHNST